jgi:hypothetical protein
MCLCCGNVSINQVNGDVYSLSQCDVGEKAFNIVKNKEFVMWSGSVKKWEFVNKSEGVIKNKRAE